MPSRIARRALLLSASLLPITRRADAAPDLSFSYQRSSALLIVLRRNGELARRLTASGLAPSFHEFQEILDPMTSDSVVFHGDCADSVPIFAQAAGAPLAYYAMERGSPAAEALVVPADSPVHDVRDLRGRSVAVQKGSGAHYLLIALMARAGLSHQDVTIEFMQAADGYAAFTTRRVDAWSIWDPFLAILEARQPVRILADATGITSYNRYYLVDAAYARAHPEVVSIVYGCLRDASAWIGANQAEAARLLSPFWGNAPQAVVETIDRRRAYRVQPVTPAAIAEQQTIADAFLKAGLIPSALRVADMPVVAPH